MAVYGTLSSEGNEKEFRKTLQETVIYVESIF